MDNNSQETFESWQARDFILDQIEKGSPEEERLLIMYEYLQLLKDWDNELGLE